MADELTVTVDKKRAKRYFILLTCSSIAGIWLLWFMLGFMGSSSSPEGVTVNDIVRTSLYSLPMGLLLSFVFPLVVRSERKKKWIVSAEGITVYEADRELLTVEWSELDDMIFREYSVGIYLKTLTPNEYNIFLPSEEACDRLAEFYNRSKGSFYSMDKA